MTQVANVAVQTIGFYKEDGIWYADLPEFLEAGLGTRANLMMVDGADTFLDKLSEMGDRITLRISPEDFKGSEIVMHKIRIGLDQAVLDAVGHAPVDYGAYYRVDKDHGEPSDHLLWLCPVTEYVFGDYPDIIYAAIV